MIDSIICSVFETSPITLKSLVGPVLKLMSSKSMEYYICSSVDTLFKSSNDIEHQTVPPEITSDMSGIISGNTKDRDIQQVNFLEEPWHLLPLTMYVFIAAAGCSFALPDS